MAPTPGTRGKQLCHWHILSESLNNSRSLRIWILSVPVVSGLVFSAHFALARRFLKNSRKFIIFASPFFEMVIVLIRIYRLHVISEMRLSDAVGISPPKDT